jgi:hypothetical protein
LTDLVFPYEIVYYGTGTPRMGMTVKCKDLLMFAANKIL